MAARGVETGHHLTFFFAEFEHGAAAAFLRRYDRFAHSRLIQGDARQCFFHHLPLVAAVGIGRHILQAASPADAEVAAKAHAFDAARRYSILPSPPGTGLSIVPRTRHPGSAAMKSTMALTAAARASASRTMPPLPMAPLPTSNCGLTRMTAQAPSPTSASARGSASFRLMKLT